MSRLDTCIYWACVVALTLISITLLCGTAGYLWGMLGDTVERLFWSAVTLWS